MIKVYVKSGRFATGDVFYVEGEMFEISESDFNRYRTLGHFSSGVLGMVKEEKEEVEEQSVPEEKPKRKVKPKEEFDFEKCRSKEKLEKFALDKFNVNLDRRKSLKKMKKEIRELIKND